MKITFKNGIIIEGEVKEIIEILNVNEIVKREEDYAE